MNGREALKALADGKRVRHVGWNEPKAHLCIGPDGELGTYGLNSTPWSYSTVASHPGPFEVLVLVAARSTDEELCAEMERLAREAVPLHAKHAYSHCARMLRERKASL